MKKTSKVGVFGGTFDPIHYGHIYLARRALYECALDEVLVVPAEAQPFKQDRDACPGRHRYNMASLAFESDDKISVSDIELRNGGVSYTIDTLREIKGMYGEGADISFILGTDAFLKIEKWKDPGVLFRDYSFIVGVRPGYRRSELEDFLKRVADVYSTNIMTISNRRVPASSTEIKRRIREGGDCGAFIPPEVEKYINANGLYRTL